MPIKDGRFCLEGRRSQNQLRQKLVDPGGGLYYNVVERSEVDDGVESAGGVFLVEA